MSCKSGKIYFELKITKTAEKSIVCAGFACINFQLKSTNKKDNKEKSLGMDSISWAVASDNGTKGHRFATVSTCFWCGNSLV